MKYLKLYEKIKSVSSIKDIINKYHDILEYIKPVVVDRYNEIANSSELDYGQNITDEYGGSSFYGIHNLKRIELKEMKIHDNKLFFTLEYIPGNSEKNEADIFYVPFTDEELENAMLKLNVKKYNL